MDSALNGTYKHLVQATNPEDVFFDLFPALEDETASPPNPYDLLDERYSNLSRNINPTSFKSGSPDRALAEEALEMLNGFYELAKIKIQRGTFGQRLAADSSRGRVIETAKRRYYVSDSLFAEGDIADLYRGSCVDGEGNASDVVLKIIRDPEDNDLAQNEIRVLHRLQDDPGKQSKHLPVFLDQFMTEDGRAGLVLRYFNGFNFDEILERHPEGISAFHAGWIMARALSVIGFAHTRGVVHCNVEPSHFLVNGSEHNIFLCDWSYAVIDPAHTGERFKARNEDYSAPEVGTESAPTPAADLYPLGKCMFRLMGGNMETGELPEDVDIGFENFLKTFILPSPNQRAIDAWALYHELLMLREQIFGKLHFVEFRI